MPEFIVNLNAGFEEKMRYALNELYSRPLSTSRADTPGGTTKMSSISTSPATAIADLVRQLGKDGADLSSVKSAFDSLEAERKQRIEKALDGAVAAAAIEKPKSRRFRLFYFADDQISALNGTAYEGAEASDADQGYYKVHVQTRYTYLCPEDYSSMKALRKALDDKKISYRISFID